MQLQPLSLTPLSFLGVRVCPVCRTIVQNHAATQTRCSIEHCPGPQPGHKAAPSTPVTDKAPTDSDDKNETTMEQLINKILSERRTTYTPRCIVYSTRRSVFQLLSIPRRSIPTNHLVAPGRTRQLFYTCIYCREVAACFPLSASPAHAIMYNALGVRRVSGTGTGIRTKASGHLTYQ